MRLTELSAWGAVLRDPDDAAARLVLADAVEEAGDVPHAEYLRLGVELAGLGGPHWQHFGHARGVRLQTESEAARAEAAAARMRELLEAHGERWLAELPPLAGASWSTEITFGGIPEGVEVEDWAAFAKTSADLVGVAPIRALELKRLDIRTARSLLTWGWLGRIRHLSLHGARVTQKALLLVLRADEASGLRSMDLSMIHLGDRGAELVAASPALAGLEALFVYGNHIADRGARAVASSPHLQGLRVLNLELNHIGTAGGSAFLDLERFPAMVHLNLFDNEPLDAEPDTVGALKTRWGDRLEI